MGGGGGGGAVAVVAIRRLACLLKDRVGGQHCSLGGLRIRGAMGEIAQCVTCLVIMMVFQV